MAKQKEQQQIERQVRIEIDDAVADGIYANLALIASNDSEFIFDFARFLPGTSREDSLQAAAAPVGTLPYGLAIACGGGWLVHLLLA